MNHNTDLPDRAIDVLAAIDETRAVHPTTQTIRETVHWAEKNQHVHYRLDQLEEANLIETWTDDDAGGRGALAPRRAKLTDAGGKFTDEEIEKENNGDIEKRVRNLEKQMTAMQRTYGRVKQSLIDVENEVEDHDEDLDDLADDIRHIQRCLDEDITENDDEDDGNAEWRMIG